MSSSRATTTLPAAASDVDWDKYTTEQAVPTGASSSDDSIDPSSGTAGSSNSTELLDGTDGEYSDYDNSTLLDDGSPPPSGTDSAGSQYLPFMLADPGY